MAINTENVLSILNKIFLEEMAGISRYLHYSFMIMGHNRIPIQKWFHEQANESMAHAVMIGEKITSLGGHPPLEMAAISETKNHNVDEILKESMAFEMKAIGLYQELVKFSEGDIALEEMARQLVREETEHIEEVQKMLRSSK